MMWIWCSECRTYHASGMHLPRWRVWCPEWQGEDFDEDLPTVVRAGCVAGAATAWAEQCESEDIESVMNGIDVVVERSDGARFRIRVTGEASIDWSARQIDIDEPTKDASNAQ